MKTKTFLVGFSLAVLVALNAPVASADTRVAVGISVTRVHDFHEPLGSYGYWVDLPTHGRCWYPAYIGSDWRPYSAGYWEWTDQGWYWVSDEPWAWATYHYGRWVYDNYYGWVWVPGVEWAPAWVSWREGGGYVGWAPLPPDGYFGPTGVLVVEHIHYHPRWWVFVENRRFCDRHRPATVIVNNTTIINKTVNITKVEKVVNNNTTVIVNNGPDVASIDRVVAQKVPRANAAELWRERSEKFSQRANREGAKPPPVASTPPIGLRTQTVAANPPIGVPGKSVVTTPPSGMPTQPADATKQIIPTPIVETDKGRQLEHRPIITTKPRPKESEPAKPVVQPKPDETPKRVEQPKTVERPKVVEPAPMVVEPPKVTERPRPVEKPKVEDSPKPTPPGREERERPVITRSTPVPPAPAEPRRQITRPEPAPEPVPRVESPRRSARPEVVSDPTPRVEPPSARDRRGEPPMTVPRNENRGNFAGGQGLPATRPAPPVPSGSETTESRRDDKDKDKDPRQPWDPSMDSMKRKR